MLAQTKIKKNLSGSEIVFECLREEKVDTLFGYPGGVVLPLYDHLYDVKDIKHVLVRHEQGATHMAEGYAKATGKVGVVLVTSGPGATNTITGITDAYMDSIPMVVITGQVPRAMIGKDSFQETDIIGISRPITKWNCLVRNTDELAATFAKAFHIAKSGRPGPVLIDIPKDVFLDSADFEYPIYEDEKDESILDFDAVLQIKSAIQIAKKPIIYAGGGVIHADAADELKRFAKKLTVPVTLTLHGLGAFPASDAQFIGMLGMHGTYQANKAIDECDLLISLGARFDDRVTGKTDLFSKKSFKIHVELDPANINKTIPVDLHLNADVKSVLKQLNEQLFDTKDYSAWFKQIELWENQAPKKFQALENPLRAQSVLAEFSKRTAGKAVFVSDVGQNQMWTAQYVDFERSRTHITSGGLGTMGFSVPAAIGAAFGRENSRVISVSGDGGFQMNMQELVTAAHNKLPIIFIILNNENLGMVRQWQELFHNERFSFTNLEASNPNFVALAEAMKVEARSVSKAEEVTELMDWAFSKVDEPCLIEFKVVNEEMVFPIVPSGGAAKDMICERMQEETK